MTKGGMFVNELADLSILKIICECTYLYQSLISAGKVYIYI